MQNYKVVFSDLAIADLNDIVQYITENESYTRAKYVERELLRTAKSLTTFPNGYAKDEYAWKIASSQYPNLFLPRYKQVTGGDS